MGSNILGGMHKCMFHKIKDCHFHRKLDNNRLSTREREREKGQKTEEQFQVKEMAMHTCDAKLESQLHHNEKLVECRIVRISSQLFDKQ